MKDTPFRPGSTWMLLAVLFAGALFPLHDANASDPSDDRPPATRWVDLYSADLNVDPSVDLMLTNPSTAWIQHLPTPARELVMLHANGELQAFHQGVQIPEHRIQQFGTTTRLLDEDGNVMSVGPVRAEWQKLDPGAYRIQSFAYPSAKPRPTIGLRLGKVGPALATQLSVDAEGTLLVTSVTEGGPAERAGVRQYDVITHIDGKPSITSEGLREAIAAKGKDATLRLDLIRGATARSIDVTIGEQKSAVARWDLALSPWNAIPRVNANPYKNLPNQNKSRLDKVTVPWLLDWTTVIPTTQSWDEKKPVTLDDYRIPKTNPDAPSTKSSDEGTGSSIESRLEEIEKRLEEIRSELRKKRGM